MVHADDTVAEESTVQRRIAERLRVPKETVADFCRKHRIRRLGLFGSVLREDFAPDSDIDVLVEFEDGHTPGLAFFGMEIELSELLGRKVDFLTAGFVNRRFRDKVLNDAVPVYEKI